MFRPCLFSSLLLLGQVHRGVAFRSKAKVDTAITVSECQLWFSALAQPINGRDALSFLRWLSFFRDQSTHIIPASYLQGTIVPAHVKMRVGASALSTQDNAVDEQEFTKWCLEDGDALKGAHVNIGNAVDEVIEVAEDVDVVKQAVIASILDGKGTYAQVLFAVNEAKGRKKTSVKTIFKKAMVETWDCLRGHNKIDADEKVADETVAREMLELFEYNVVQATFSTKSSQAADEKSRCESFFNPDTSGNASIESMTKPGKKLPAWPPQSSP